MTYIIIIICIAILWFIIKPYIIKHDTVTLYVGGLGSGKTLVGVSDALRCLKRNRLKVWLYNLWHKDKKQKPLFYSTIPVKVSKKEMSIDLTLQHVLLQARIVEKSIIFIDEASTVANAFETVANNHNLKTVEEFSTFFRHYTKGGYMILTTQNTSKCNYTVRYCCNQAFQLSQFRKFFNLFYWVKIRNIDLTNDVVNVNQTNIEENCRTLIGFFGRKKYDTYAFSVRYDTVPYQEEKTSKTSLKRLEFIDVPREYQEPCTYQQKDRKKQERKTFKNTFSI